MKRIGSIILSIVVFSFVGYAETEYERGINQWRIERQNALLADGGWLTVSGLFCLKDGVNTVGSGSKYDVELTNSFNAAEFGEIVFSGGKAILTIEPGVNATSDGKPFTTVELISDEKAKPTKIQIGSQSFFLIKREDRYGIRLKDEKSPARTNFAGLKWFPVDPNLKVTATLEPFPEPKEILVPNVLGGSFPYKSPGLLRFKIGGKEYTLQPVGEGKRLFIIFRDLTSRKSTYGSGRFLYADAPKDGKVELDFNKAENPRVCAFTAFATCPLPPQQNRLEVAIPAGEKRYHQ